MMANLLLTYPKSGNTWMRYIVEYLSEQPTVEYQTNIEAAVGNGIKLDCLGARLKHLNVDLSKPAILIKRHSGDFRGERWSEKDKLIIIVRDYRESLYRALYKVTPAKLHKRCDAYMHILEFFNQFTGKKQIIYYEDLITDFEGIVDTVVSFLNIKKDKVDSLLSNYEYHKKACLEWYGTSITLGNKIEHHSNYGISETFKDLIESRINHSSVEEGVAALLKRYTHPDQ